VARHNTSTSNNTTITNSNTRGLSHFPLLLSASFSIHRFVAKRRPQIYLGLRVLCKSHTAEFGIEPGQKNAFLYVFSLKRSLLIASISFEFTIQLHLTTMAKVTVEASSGCATVAPNGPQKSACACRDIFNVQFYAKCAVLKSKH